MNIAILLRTPFFMEQPVYRTVSFRTSSVKINQPCEKSKEGGKLSLTIFVNKSENEGTLKSFNSSGFNPILQGFYKMICEIIVSKTGAEFS